jgi:tetratricopeptide (TPR) repeat protein
VSDALAGSIDQLGGALGLPADALQLLAVAESLDDALACSLLERFAGTNGSTPSTVAAVKSLPFVVRRDGDGWRFLPAVRDELLGELRARDDDRFVAVSQFLSRRFEEIAGDEASREAREARWRAAIHALPIDVDVVLDHLEQLSNGAVGLNRASDLDSSVELTRRHPGAFRDRAPEVAYFVGRQAYAKQRWEIAEARFRAALATHRPSMRATALRLLANILLRRRGDADEAVRLARESLEIESRLRHPHNRAITQVTLARALLRASSGAAPGEVLDVLDDALRTLGLERDTRGQCLALNARGSYHRRRDDYESAEHDFQNALSLARVEDMPDQIMLILVSLADVLLARGGRRRLEQARSLLGESERIARQAHDDYQIAVIVNARSRIAEGMGDHERAIELAYEELELRRSLGRQEEVRLTQQRIAKLQRNSRRRGGRGRGR